MKVRSKFKLGPRIIVALVLLGAMNWVACSKDKSESSSSDSEDTLASELPTAWSAVLGRIDVNPGTLPASVQTFLDEGGDEPTPVRLMIGTDGTSITILDGPVKVRSGSLKFQRTLQSRVTEAPDGWWLFWDKDGEPIEAHAPIDWAPIDTGPKVRGFHDHDATGGHSEHTVYANAQFPVMLPFYPEGHVVAITQKGQLLGSWRYGIAANDPLQKWNLSN